MLDFKSFFKVVSSNFIVLIIGIIVTFLLPKIITPTEYGYYSLFNLYVSYAGISLLGYVDGIYLKYGGCNYSELNTKEFSSYFWKITIWELFITTFFVIYSIFFINGEKQSVLIFTAIGILLESISSFFVNIDKMTSRFDIYAKENIIYKLTLFIAILLSVIFKQKIYDYLFIILISGKIITLIYQIYHSHNIITSKPDILSKESIKRDSENIKIGSILTFSLVCTMLMTGFGKFLVENRLGIEQLGYYSFVFSIMSLFTLIINSISTVLYPKMRQMKQKDSAKLTKNINEIIILISPLILMCFYPCKIIIEHLFQSYINSIQCLIYLFPIIIIQTKISVIYNNYYKVVREENKMFKNNLIAIIMCILITFINFLINPCIESVAYSTLISYIIWDIINAKYFKKSKYLDINIINQDVILIIIYIVVTKLVNNSLIGFAISTITVLIYIIIYKKKYVNFIKYIKNKI